MPLYAPGGEHVSAGVAAYSPVKASDRSLDGHLGCRVHCRDLTHWPPMTDGDELRDVDLWTLRTALTEDDHRRIAVAWRDPEPVARDTVLSAVAAVSVRKTQLAAGFAAIFWGIMSLQAVVGVMSGSAGRGGLTYTSVYALCSAGLSGVGTWTWLRARRARKLLVDRTDVAAAARRARELRALRSSNRNERPG